MRLALRKRQSRRAALLYSTAGATVGTLCRLHAGFTTLWRVSVARLRVRAVVAVARSLLALLQQTKPQPKELQATQRTRAALSPLARGVRCASCAAEVTAFQP